MAITKNFEIISKKFDSSINYSVDEAVDKAKDLKFSNFDESLDIAVCLGLTLGMLTKILEFQLLFLMVQVRSVRVLVIAEGEKQKKPKMLELTM